MLVIGLGRFGAATAGQLDRQDREVLVVDTDMQLVQKWADRVTHAVQADARSMEALRQIGADQFQIAVVATGASIEASVLIAANLVDLGIPQIWAKAVSLAFGGSNQEPMKATWNLVSGAVSFTPAMKAFISRLTSGIG